MLSFGQTTQIKGGVKDKASSQSLYGVNIKIIGEPNYAITNENGTFTVETDKDFPVELRVSTLGYEEKTVKVYNSKTIEIVLSQSYNNLDAVVVSASRVPERVFESPVTIERMSLSDIENTTAASFYEGLENLKGVDINKNSLTYNTINTRGFATFGNTRFVQLVDGLDNSSPGLNFSLGNLIGLNELDVNSVEILPGASSALYGANAFNGMLFMTSKNPFKTEGVGVYAKSGVTSSSNAGTNSFINIGFRIAKKFSDKLAIKLTGTLIDATEWSGTDARNVIDGNVASGTRESDPNYNGINIYGDLVSTNIRNVGLFLESLGSVPSGTSNLLVPDENVSRTGYTEQELSDPKSNIFRTALALHYKPFGDREEDEIIYVGKIGTGNTLYQGASRYAIRDFILHQHKIEYKNEHLLVRSYATVESAGDTYDVRFAGVHLNSAWKDNNTWFGEYVGAFIQAKSGAVPTVTPNNDEAAHAFARSIAETGRLHPGTVEFNQALATIKADPDVLTGARLAGNNIMFHGDAVYSFKDQIDFADVILGASTRRYTLDSDGTIYTDTETEKIAFNEYGLYSQLKKGFLENTLNFTVALRYDKSDNFEGRFTPKLAMTYKLDSEDKHILRAGFQTGFRNPTTQDQYIGLDVGTRILVGTANDNLDRVIKATGVTPREVLETTGVAAVKQEKVISYELGYRSKLSKTIVLDATMYYNDYDDFITQRRREFNGRIYSITTNKTKGVSSYGGDIGLTTKLFHNFDFGVNYTLAKLDTKSLVEGETTNFNTSSHKAKMHFGHKNIVENLGFGLDVRWQDAYNWESAFVDGRIGARYIVDAQISYAIKKWNSKLKVGGANILQNEFITGPGAGLIGAQYYASWTSNF